MFTTALTVTILAFVRMSIARPTNDDPHPTAPSPKIIHCTGATDDEPSFANKALVFGSDEQLELYESTVKGDCTGCVWTATDTPDVPGGILLTGGRTNLHSDLAQHHKGLPGGNPVACATLSKTFTFEDSQVTATYHAVVDDYANTRICHVDFVGDKQNDVTGQC